MSMTEPEQSSGTFGSVRLNSDPFPPSPHTLPFPSPGGGSELSRTLPKVPDSSSVIDIPTEGYPKQVFCECLQKGVFRLWRRVAWKRHRRGGVAGLAPPIRASLTQIKENGSRWPQKMTLPPIRVIGPRVWFAAVACEGLMLASGFRVLWLKISMQLVSQKVVAKHF